MILNEFLEEIIDTKFDDLKLMLIIHFKMGFTLYIQYNDFNEYSYHIQFTQKPNDFIRYDNYDDRWNVKTKPHHLHQRWKKEAITSPMQGKPEMDIPILIKIIKDILE